MGAPLLLVFALNVVTLEEAVSSAERHQPAMTQARGLTAAARAREGEALSPLLPQGSLTLEYRRTTANSVANPGFLPLAMSTAGAMTPERPAVTDTFNFYRINVGLTQLLWDFGLSLDNWRASRELARAQSDSEEASRLTVIQNVRSAFFTARANKSLLEVARDTLENRQKHLDQIEGFVRVGTRPEIDSAQARADRANAEVQVIQGENNYETAKAQLNLAMGVAQGTDYEVSNETLPPVPGEDGSTESLLVEALKNRPDVASFDKQLRAQELAISSARGAYFPALATQLSFNDQATDSSNGWNAYANLIVSNFGFFQGFLTQNKVREARANLEVIGGQREQLRQQTRLDVEQARLAVRAGKATIRAANEVLVNAKERLRLAEGRYQAGVGNIIELSDAEVANTTAAAQLVQAQYNLSTARAQLLRATGQR